MEFMSHGILSRFLYNSLIDLLENLILCINDIAEIVNSRTRIRSPVISLH